MKTKAEMLKKWVDALRSDQYDQAQRALRSHEGYCCLGVMCEVYRDETGRGTWLNGPDMTFAIDGGESKRAYPPREVLKSFGVELQYLALGDMNDLQQRSFEEIATFVEQNIIAGYE